jgi:ssDNA-binding Zn-finger/Zn-ribbon topoisomerase 1
LSSLRTASRSTLIVPEKCPNCGKEARSALSDFSGFRRFHRCLRISSIIAI